MQMDNAQLLSWAVTLIGITGFFLIGKKIWWAWYVNIGCQGVWYAYAFFSGQPAFYVAASFYSVVFGINAYKWTKEHRQKAAGPVPEELESNLLRHAQKELILLGEDDDTIQWYLNVIDSYRSFGHSGGSHMAVMPVLFKLLNYEPLTPLTNNDEEWHFHGEDLWDEPGGIWQNKRDGRMFSKDGGLTYTNVDDPKDPEGNKPVYCSVITDSYV